MDKKHMQEYRCMCGKLLFKGAADAVVEIKCRHCRKITLFLPETTVVVSG